MAIRTKSPSADDGASDETPDTGPEPQAKNTQGITKLKVEEVHASELKPNTYNPNWQDHHEFELLLRSMKDDGFTTPILVQKDTMEIVDGEHRWTGAIVSAYLNKMHPIGKDEFWSQKLVTDARERRLDLLSEVDPIIPIVKTPMTAEQMRVATLRHNRARGEEDVELAAEVLRDLEAAGALPWAAEELMLDDETIKRLMEDVSAAEALGEDEFTEAWDPSDTGDEGADGEGAGTDAETSETGTRANSAAASDLRRERLERVRKAKNEEERKLALKETAIFRLNLVLGGDEAKMVMAVLGDKPAVALLALCAAEIDRNPDLAPVDQDGDEDAGEGEPDAED